MGEHRETPEPDPGAQPDADAQPDEVEGHALVLGDAVEGYALVDDAEE